MSLISGSFKRTNAIFLLLLLPILLRFWVEAVLWRLKEGPQMLGFQLMHGAAVWLTPVLFLSILATFTYYLWVAFVCVRWLIPTFRKQDRHHLWPLIGGGAVFLFYIVANFLQLKDLSPVQLYGNAVVLSLLVLVTVGLVFFGFKTTRTKNVSA